MTRYIESKIELPWQLRLRLAGYACAGATVVVSFVGVILKLAVLDTFEAALANLHVSTESPLSLPTILLILLTLIVLFTLGLYSVLSQYVQGQLARLQS